jgi:hypothetical protein
MSEEETPRAGLINWSEWRKDGGKFFRISVIGAFAAWIGAYVPVVNELVFSPWRLGDKVDANTQTLSHLVEDVKILQRPDVIFRISRSDVLGPRCGGGRSCAIEVEIERTEEGRNCQIVPGKTRYSFRNPRTDASLYVRLDRPVQSQNVGSRPVTFQYQVTAPYGLEPNAEFCLEPLYTGCPGMSDGDAPIRANRSCTAVPVEP